MDQRVEFPETLNHITQGAVAAVPRGLFDGRPGLGLFLEDLLADPLNLVD